MSSANRALLAVLLALVAGCNPGCKRHEDAPADGMSLIVITVDTLRADHMSCYGYGKPTTPRLDQLAASGARFERCVTPIPRTTEALASLLTGKNPAQHGVRGLAQTLAQDQVTFPERFKDAGFTNAARLALPFFVKRLGNQGLDQGFESDCIVYGNQRELRANELTDEALRWLGAKKSERFTLWLHYRDPHAPYFPPPPFTDRFDPGYEGPYKSSFHYWPIDKDGRPAGGAITEEMQADKAAHKFGRVKYGDARTLEHIRSLYDGEIAFTDSEIGRLLDGLASLGLGEKTVVLVTADHGESLGEHDFWFDHGEFLYETCVHVPLILRVPGRPAAVVKEQVGLIDVAPTLLELFGLEPPRDGLGRSFAAAVTGGKIEGHELFVESGEALMWKENPRFHAIVKSGVEPKLDPRDDVTNHLRAFATKSRFKGVIDPLAPPERQLQLFRVSDDPNETHDLAAEPEERETAESARKLLRAVLAAQAAATSHAPIDAEQQRLLNEGGYPSGGH